MAILKYYGIVESSSVDNAYALLLSNYNNEKHIPVIIGKTESQQILIAKQDIETPTPMPFMVMCNILKTLGYTPRRLEILVEQEGIYYAQLVIVPSEGFYKEEVGIRIRVSDGVAICCKYRKQIIIEDKLFKRLAVSFKDIEQGRLLSVFETSISPDQTISDLEERMAKASSDENYELAAQLRDRIEELKKMSNGSSVLSE